MPNTDLLTRTLVHTELNQAELDQAEWLPRWGSRAMCFAGHAVAQAGIPAAYVRCRRAPGNRVLGQYDVIKIPAVMLGDVPADHFKAAVTAGTSSALRGVWCAVEEPYHFHVPVPHVAQLLLGLTDDQADTLFSPMNTPGDLRAIVTGLCGAGGAL